MNIKRIILREIEIPLVHPFRTSFGTQDKKECILVEIQNNEGLSGWSEISVTRDPGYTYETITTAWHILNDFLIPEIQKKADYNTINEFVSMFHKVRGHNITKAGLEIACTVLQAEEDNKLLNESLNIAYRPIQSGVSIGIQKNYEDLVHRIQYFLDKKYKRIKLKIEPGWDIDVIKNLRSEFGNDVQIMVDANSAYTLHDINHLKKLDEFQLMMIEQPLGYSDIIDHIKLQNELKTAICLDESIHSFDDAKNALEYNACKIINIKVGRVGGLHESLKIAEFIKRNKSWDAWCGGMLETGVGRMTNVYLQMHKGFSLPGDTSGSDRYFHHDVIDPPVTVSNGVIDAPKNGTGLGVNILGDLIEKSSKKSKSYDF